MRKAKWVLYQDGQEFYIIEDLKTPLVRLNRLEHFVGIYYTYEHARNLAVEKLKFKIKHLKRNIDYLMKGYKK